MLGIFDWQVYFVIVQLFTLYNTLLRAVCRVHSSGESLSLEGCWMEDTPGTQVWAGGDLKF